MLFSYALLCFLFANTASAAGPAGDGTNYGPPGHNPYQWLHPYGYHPGQWPHPYGYPPGNNPYQWPHLYGYPPGHKPDSNPGTNYQSDQQLTSTASTAGRGPPLVVQGTNLNVPQKLRTAEQHGLREGYIYYIRRGPIVSHNYDSRQFQEFDRIVAGFTRQSP